MTSITTVVAKTISIGVDSKEGTFTIPLFELGEEIGGGNTETKRGFYKLEDNQTVIGVPIYLGDRKGEELIFDDLEPGINPEYEIQFTVKLEDHLTENVIITAKMINLDTGEVTSEATIDP
ncbi:hypothetical protein EKH57_00245 (plasmid) [Halorubrum sp. BOL3-1]|uniref:hypothetical protein n=1 Tax=Halorubrum sp. BOL3-1 TaxID=2497325 RepID=UPI0010050B9E|nr:hypothetical protein [Halorubrum sp. BOL3-1]QAU11355.1 hypothetical protein EKH57_00245 [Halorubrum sp. BOL3-1]